MQADKQQQIIGYFIEEADEHLNTLENGLLNLQTVMEDPETINEMFRAAHSVKGGAAMLGFGSIQKTAHHLEDCLKILKEHTVPADERLVSLFLNGLDTLKKLTDELKGPFGLQEEAASEIVKASEPMFVELEAYLNQLVGTEGDSPALPPDFLARVMTLLKQMLVQFKQPDSINTRKTLQGLCDQLGQLAGSEVTWQTLMATAKTAVGNSAHNYAVLAPIVIKEIKQASELLQAGRISEVVASPRLRQLETAVAPQKPAAKPTPVSPKPVPTQSATPVATSAPPNTIALPKEPRAAAKLLIQSFDRRQLMELTKLLIVAVKQQQA